MKGKSKTAAQERFWDRLANEVGCIACRKLYGPHDPGEVSIHHFDGRVKGHSHWLVLPLCAGHHQQGTSNNPDHVGVHPYKARFEERFGKQETLLMECCSILGVIPDGLKQHWGMDECQDQ